MRQRHGPWLRHERQVRGWNVPEMARQLREAATSAGDKLPDKDCVLVMIHRWENNRSGISERYRLHYCHAFDIPIDQFGGHLAATDAGHGPGQPPDTEPAVADTGTASAAVHPVSPCLHPIGSGRCCRGDDECPVDCAGDSIGQQFLAAARESGDHASRAEQRGIGQVTLDRFGAMAARLSRDSAAGEPIALFFRMCRARDQMHAAACVRSWPADRDALYVLLGWVNSLMATATWHAGNPAAAEELALAGLTYAAVTGHPDLTARLWLDLAVIAHWSGSFRACLDRATTGLAQEPAGPVAARLHLISARAAAGLGDIEAARHAIKDADQARDRVSAGYMAEISGQAGFFSPASCHYYTGAALSEIPAADREAITELERAIELYTAATEPGRAHEHDEMTARADLATVLLRVGDLDAAQVAAGPVLALPCSRRVSSLAGSFVRVQAELAGPRYQNSAQARDFTAQIDLFRADTIATHLGDTPDHARFGQR